MNQINRNKNSKIEITNKELKIINFHFSDCLLRGLASITIHETYKAYKQVGTKTPAGPFDIAILELKAEDELDLSTYTPACMAKSDDFGSFVNKTATVAGWGMLYPGGEGQYVPRHVEVVVRSSCHPLGDDNPSDLCAWDVGKDACPVSFSFEFFS